jgi:hypothetical protein
MKVNSVAVLALLGKAIAIQVEQKYDISEGPTKADYGENDNGVVGREADLDNLNNKESGWVNPLSLADDGNDDD